MSTLGVTTEPPCPRAQAVRMCSMASSLVSRSIGSPMRVQRSGEPGCPDPSVVRRADVIVSLISPASARGRRGALDPAEGRALERASRRCAVLAVGGPRTGVEQARGPAVALGPRELELVPEAVAVHKCRRLEAGVHAELGK